MTITRAIKILQALPQTGNVPDEVIEGIVQKFIPKGWELAGSICTQPGPVSVGAYYISADGDVIHGGQ
jgi:hypothetical protein